MSADSLLPIAPARVKVLVLPIGQIKAARFASFLERIHGEHVVHLRDVGADKRPNRSMMRCAPSLPWLPPGPPALTLPLLRHVLSARLP